MYRVASLLFVCAGVVCAAPPDAVSQAKAVMAGLPMRFEENRGQARPDARYLARASGYTLEMTATGPAMTMGTHRVELRFDVFNLLNRLNVATVNNIIGLNPAAPPATFGTITGVRDQRQAQVAVRYRF